MAWSIQGKSMELCNCKVLCPCWLSPEVEPDQGWCGGAFLFEISEGTSEGINLSGCKVAVGFEWPGNFWKGEGAARLYIDEAASAEQRRELEAIFGGQKGGPVAAVLPAVVARVLPTQYVPIGFQWDGDVKVTVGSVASVNLQPLADQAGHRTTVRGALAMGAFQLDESMDVASSKGSSWNDPELRSWQGDSGTLHSFHWSS